MNQQEALAKARKLFGPNAYLAANDKALSAEQKEPLLTRRDELRRERAKIEAEIASINKLVGPVRRQINNRTKMNAAWLGGGHVWVASTEATGDTWADCFRNYENTQNAKAEAAKSEAAAKGGVSP